MVGDCGDRTLEGPSGSGRGSYSRRSLRPAGGRQRLNLKPEGEALLKLPQRARMVLQSPDTRPWGFGSQVHTPYGDIQKGRGPDSSERRRFYRQMFGLVLLIPVVMYAASLYPVIPRLA